MEDATRTYQTRCGASPLVQEVLAACAHLFSHVEHCLLADISKGKTPGQLKSSYLIEHGITARHFNSIRVKLEGKIASIKELRKTQILDLKEQIKTLEAKITRLEKKFWGSLRIHQKKRRLHKFKQKLENLIKDQEQDKVSLCFGSKQLFRSQFDLEANGYQTHEQWREDWNQARANEIFFLGSKDESSGNQTCTATVEEDNSI